MICPLFDRERTLRRAHLSGVLSELEVLADRLRRANMLWLTARLTERGRRELDQMDFIAVELAEIPVGPLVGVSPMGLEGDVWMKVESQWRRSRQVTAQPEQVNGRVLKQTRH